MKQGFFKILFFSFILSLSTFYSFPNDSSNYHLLNTQTSNLLSKTHFYLTQRDENNNYLLEANLTPYLKSNPNILKIELKINKNKDNLFAQIYTLKGQNINLQKYKTYDLALINEVLRNSQTITNESKEILKEQNNRLNYLLKPSKKLANTLENDMEDLLNEYTSTDYYFDLFQTSLSPDDLLNVIPIELLKNTDVTSFIGKEYDFLIENTDYVKNIDATTYHGCFALIDIETTLPILDFYNDSQMEYDVLGPKSYSYTLKILPNNFILTVKSIKERYLLRNFRFAGQIQNYMRPNKGDENYNINSDYGCFLTNTRFHYTAVGPLIWNESQMERASIDYTVDTVLNLIGFIPGIGAFATLISQILSTYDLASASFQDIIDTPERDFYNFDTEKQESVFPSSYQQQLKEYGELIRFSLMAPHFDDEKPIPMIGENNHAKAIYSFTAPNTMLKNTPQSEIYLGFGCEIVKDETTRDSGTKITVLDNFSCFHNYGNMQMNIGEFDTKSYLSFNVNQELYPDEKMINIITKESNDRSYEIKLNQPNVQIVVKSYTIENEKLTSVRQILDVTTAKDGTVIELDLLNKNENKYFIEITNLNIDKTIIEIDFKPIIDDTYTVKNMPNSVNIPSNTSLLDQVYSIKLNLEVVLSSATLFKISKALVTITPYYNFYIDIYNGNELVYSTICKTSSSSLEIPSFTFDMMELGTDLTILMTRCDEYIPRTPFIISISSKVEFSPIVLPPIDDGIIINPPIKIF